MTKKLFYVIVIMFITIGAKAQMSEYTTIFDSVFQYVSRTNATTGILYERVIPFSGLFRFGVANISTDTINSEIFLQGYSEMYHAAFDYSKRLPVSPDSLETRIISNSSIIDIGLFHYRYNTFDSIARQKLYFDADSIVRENTAIAGSLYTENEIFIASPLIDETDFQTITFRLSNTFHFDNTTNPVVAVEIDFDDGNGYQIRHLQ